MAGGLDSFDWLKDRIKRPSVVVDLSQVEEPARHQGAERRPRDRRRHDAHRGRARSAGARQVRVVDGGGRARGLAADPQPGDHRRQRLAGHALLVLPRRVDVLPGRRQHLLCRHADRDQSRARDSRRRPLRGGEPVRHGAGARRARCPDGHPERARRARRRRRGLLHRPGDRHHADDGPGAGRAADGDSDSVDVGRRAVLLRESPRPERLGLPAAQRGVGGHVLGPDTSSASAWWSTPRRRGRCACTRWRRRSSASRETSRRRSSPVRSPCKGRSRCATTATRSR